MRNLSIAIGALVAVWAMVIAAPWVLGRRIAGFRLPTEPTQWTGPPAGSAGERRLAVDLFNNWSLLETDDRSPSRTSA